MRTLLYTTGALAVAATLSPDVVRSALAAAAGALVESVPFLFAGLVAARLLGTRCRAIEYFGCGCGNGPSARSVPAAVAAWMLFGPWVSMARFSAAVMCARILRGRLSCAPHRHAPQPLTELSGLLPASLLAGAAFEFFSTFDAARLTPIGDLALGAALGFCAAPCGLGAVAVAAALHARAPLAATAFLCVAGIADLRAFQRASRHHDEHDALAYALLAAALALVAWRHGDALVRPSIAVAAGGCALVAFAFAIVFRHRQSPRSRIAPALMLAAALAGAPPPSYHATETTLGDLFAGERISFTGRLTRHDSAAALVRYAITCCRADAAPIVLRLASPPGDAEGTWLRVDGSIEEVSGELQLVPRRLTRIEAPGDPFIYR